MSGLRIPPFGGVGASTPAAAAATAAAATPTSTAAIGIAPRSSSTSSAVKKDRGSGHAPAGKARHRDVAGGGNERGVQRKGSEAVAIRRPVLRSCELVMGVMLVVWVLVVLC